MTEFTDLELNKEVSELDGEDAKQTLVDFIEAHQTNRAAYDELQAELDETETEYQEKVESLEETVAEFKSERAEEAAEYVNMPAEILAERFSFDELDQIIEEAEESEEFSEDNEPEEEEEDGSLTTFSDKPPKGKETGGSGEPSKTRQKAREMLAQRGVVSND